jgi:hypothetical protein
MKWKVEHLKKTVPLLLAHGEAAELVTEVAGRVYSTRVSYLLRRDTAIPFTSPAAKIPIIVREIRPDDFPVIVSERPIRLPALESGLKTCHVATTENNDICYMQWLIDSSQNELIDREFAGLCPTLKQNEMLLEWAYTFKKYRGLAVMASAMSQISERGAACGARWLYTFVATDNIASLRGCRSAGFRPYQIRTERWRLLRCSESFETLPECAKYPFEEAVAR